MMTDEFAELVAAIEREFPLMPWRVERTVSVDSAHRRTGESSYWAEITVNHHSDTTEGEFGATPLDALRGALANARAWTAPDWMRPDEQPIAHE